MQERRALIRKHNIESEQIEREIEKSEHDSTSVNRVEGEAMNAHARKAQTNPLGG